MFNEFLHLPLWHEILCNCFSSQSKIYFILFLISLFFSKAENLFMSLSLRNHPLFNSAPRSCTNSDSDTLFAEIWLQGFFFFASWAIVQSQSVWKALWGSLWLEMKIAFGNPTKRINFDFISGLFSKLIINLPAGPVPSTRLVGEGGMAHVKQEQSENHGAGWVGKNFWRFFVFFKSQTSTPILWILSALWLFPQQKLSTCANSCSEQHFCLRKSLSVCLAPV